MKENINIDEYVTRFTDILPSILTANGLQKYSDATFTDLFATYYRTLLEHNAEYNLTAITEPERAALLHIVDSLTIADLPYENSRVIDIGSGAGLPAIPLAIARPDISVFAVDGNEKKVHFIRTAAIWTGIKNVTAIYGRAEELGHGAMRSKYDFVTARAVAPLNIICELCTPFLRKTGVFIAMRGSKGDAEAESCKETCYNKLNLTEIERRHLQLVGLSDEKDAESVSAKKSSVYSRTIILICKNAPIPQIYPRRYANIKKSPL